MSTFSRDDVLNYEKTARAPAAAPQPNTAKPAATTQVQPEADPSPSDAAADEAVDDGSSAPAGDSAALVTSDDTGDTDAADASADESADETADAETDGETDETQQQGNKKPSRKARRIGDLVAANKALRETLEYQQGVIAQLTQKPAAAPAATPAPAAAAAPVETDPMPTLEQYGFDSTKFNEALTRWTDKRVESRVKAAMDGQTAQQRAEASRAAFEGRVNAFTATHPDFAVVVGNPRLPPLAQEAAALLVQHENGPAIVYHLARNPDRLARIARMAPDAQKMALGRVEAEISAPAAAPAPRQTKNVTKAPAPPRQVPAGSAPGRDPNSPGTSMKEFADAHNAGIRAKQDRRDKNRRR